MAQGRGEGGMKKKKKNERCPLQSECDKTCDYKFAEKSCPYYMANARPGCELDSPEPVPAFDFDNIDKEIEEASEIYGYTDDERKLTYIPVDQIYPHPDNPRKDLGDLGELSDSIKKNGIYQNLTVVPLKSKLKPNLQLNGYTVIIGHRRLEAAKIAGLTEVPCVIADMTEQEQLATMLLENMQRSDLTVYEQAKCFQQLMMDFGSTVSDIAEKTGFSETTVRRRVKLLELDEMAFKVSEERGATLSDYIKLEEIKDVALRNEVLASIGTKDFGWKYQNALQREKSAANKQAWIDLVSQIAVEVDSSERANKSQIALFNRTSTLNEANRAQVLAAHAKKELGEIENLYYCVDASGYWLYLLTDRTEDENAEIEQRKTEQQRNEEKRRRLELLCKTAKTLRRNFVSEYTGKKDSVPFLLAKCFERGCTFDLDEKNAVELLSIKVEPDEVTSVFSTDEFLDIIVRQPQRTLLLALWNDFDIGYRVGETFNWDLKYQQNDTLLKWYEILESVSYQISTEEQQMLDGTHPAYKDEEVCDE